MSEYFLIQIHRCHGN